MSKTLRRPMFRGGRVSAYGTGIAAPLVPGYQSGGSINEPRRGLVTLPGGYAGNTAPLFNVDDVVAKTQTGGELIEENVPTFTVPTSNFEELTKIKEFEKGTIYDEEYLTNEFNKFVHKNKTNVETGGVSEMDLETGQQMPTPISSKEGAFYDLYKADPEAAYEQWKSGVVTGEDWGAKQKEQIEIAGKAGHDLGIETDLAPTELTAEQIEINRLNKIIADKTEEPTEVDAKAMVAENKALFADLLGLDKARGEDITSMLLGFAGSKGDTTMEKFQDFAAKEAVRPGRRQKLEDAAGTLAIQDYVAGKRSKEKIEEFKKGKDYDYKLKLDTAMPRETDTLEEVAFKLNSAGLTYSSTKGLRMIIGIKDDTPMGDNVVALEKGIKIADLEKGRNTDKLLKKLKPGYNILNDDGVVRIIKYDGSGSAQGVDVYTISQFWNL